MNPLNQLHKLNIVGPSRIDPWFEAMYGRTGKLSLRQISKLKKNSFYSLTRFLILKMHNKCTITNALLIYLQMNFKIQQKLSQEPFHLTFCATESAVCIKQPNVNCLSVLESRESQPFRNYLGFKEKGPVR